MEGDPVAVVDVADRLAAVRGVVADDLHAGGVAVVLGLPVAGLRDVLVVRGQRGLAARLVRVLGVDDAKMLALGSCSPSARVFRVPVQPVAEVCGWSWLVVPDDEVDLHLEQSMVPSSGRSPSP